MVFKPDRPSSKNKRKWEASHSESYIEGQLFRTNCRNLSMPLFTMHSGKLFSLSVWCIRCSSLWRVRCMAPEVEPWCRTCGGRDARSVMRNRRPSSFFKCFMANKRSGTAHLPGHGFPSNTRNGTDEKSCKHFNVCVMTIRALHLKCWSLFWIMHATLKQPPGAASAFYYFDTRIEQRKTLRFFLNYSAPLSTKFSFPVQGNRLRMACCFGGAAERIWWKTND